jgi:ribonucleoside-diphosphate reductase alpha chain
VGLLVRSEKLTGATYKLRWPDSEHAFYVTINDVETDGIRRPFEIFINSKNLEHYAWVVALTRMISAVFRRGGDVSFVADELKQVFDPRGGQWADRRYVPSLVAAIGEILERHMIDTGFLPLADPVVTRNHLGSAAIFPKSVLGPLCPKCCQPGLVKEAGCPTCVHCGWSKCS